MKQDKLNVMYCMPHEKLPPNERFIRVKVSDGKRTEIIDFGRHTPFKTVVSQIPVIFGHRTSGKSRKKAV
ncbi:hypothetical protein HHO41_04825 [Bacillus sp. DNRA2]|uniref:hypothetical protein n=1 Tax=Bacillus sp. DNRA2 TaxID=2723053 RepID=UPI00145C8D01|nr:hypothetical protein [Bacillus sp. DNRA2]NMD69604.1 hypothetical protein [Bacillus sp. DNRA2]